MASGSPRGAPRTSRGTRSWSRPTSARWPAVLRLRDVDTSYGRIRVLRRVNLEVAAGEIVCLLGGNASGKSTTMKTILGVVRPTRGTVEFDGQVINDVR